MMRRIRRLVVYTAMTGLLAAGAVTATIGVAHANFAAICPGSSPSYSCTLTSTIPSPSALSVTVTDDTANATEVVTVTWTISCTDSTLGTVSEPQNGASSATPVTVPLAPLPPTAAGQCHVTANVGLSQTQPGGSTITPTAFETVLNYTPSSSPTPTPTPTSTSTSSRPPVHPIKGYGGKCVDDNGNSSANRAKVQIWSCSSTDQAESWTFSNGEFKHNGKCMNDQGNGGIRSHVILWTCNGASNEKWSQLANGELQLKSHGGTLCLDDPRSSTTNGTQLIVYTCTDSANQKWSLP